MMFIYLAAVVVLILWALKSLREKKIILRKTYLDLPLALFFLSQLISTITSIDRQTSFLGYYGRFNGGLLSLVAYIVLFYGLVTFFSFKDVKKFLKISIISSILVILWGLPGKLGYDLSCLVFTGQFNNSCWTDQFRPHERMFSTLGQPNWLGAHLAINFFFGLFFYIESWFEAKKEFTRKQIFYNAYLLLVVASLLFTRSRSSYLGLGVGVLVFFILSAPVFLKFSADLKKKTKKAVLIVIVPSLIFLLLFKTGIPKIDNLFSWPNSSQQNTKQKSITTSEDVTESLDIRKIVWKGAVDLGLKNPLFGTGVETFAYSYYLVRPKEHNLTSEWDYLYNKAHNEYLNYFATTGFIGLVAYFFLLFSFFKNAGMVVFSRSKSITFNKYKSEDETYGLQKALFAAWCTILVTNFFGFSTTTINVFFYLIPGLFLLVSIQDKTQPAFFREKKVDLNPRVSHIVLGLISVFSLGWLLLYYIADIQYASAGAYAQSGDYQKSTELYNHAVQLHYEHVYEDKLSYSFANMAFLAAYQKEQKTANELMKLADAHNIRTLNASPQNPLYWKTRGKNYYLFYQITLDGKHLKKGIEALEQDQRLSPTDPKVPYTIAVFNSLLEDEAKDPIQKQDFQNKALFYAIQATQLKPDFRDAYFLQGQLYKKYGNGKEAEAIFQEILKKDPDDREVKEEYLNLEKDLKE